MQKILPNKLHCHFKCSLLALNQQNVRQAHHFVFTVQADFLTSQTSVFPSVACRSILDLLAILLSLQLAAMKYKKQYTEQIDIIKCLIRSQTVHVL